MTKHLFIMGALIIIVAIAWIFLAKHFVESARAAYQKPDTTVTYKNGRWDTVIVKNPIPAWLK